MRAVWGCNQSVTRILEAPRVQCSGWGILGQPPLVGRWLSGNGTLYTWENARKPCQSVSCLGHCLGCQALLLVMGTQ